MGDNIATKIEDNEPCPCGERGNYGSCHGQILVQNHWRALKTKEVYSEILNSSRTALKKYYEENAKIYAKKIIFAVDEENEHNQPSVNLCSAVEEKSFYHIIIFDSTNVSRAKDSIVAHEFEHVVIQEKKFPIIFDTRRDYNFISRQLINLMEDPLIYPKLKNYFKVEEDLIMNVEGLKAQITRYGLFLHGIYRATNSFCCARAHLMQRAFYGEDDHLNLYKFINENIPKVIPEIDYIINIFEENNYDTPKKQNEILSKLIQHYNLSNYIQIRIIP